MTTSVPPSRGPSQLVDVRTPHLEPSMFARAEKPAHPTTLTLPGVRRRGPKGEAIVVIANPPPFSQLIISFQQDRDRPGPSGVSVAVQAIPYFAESDAEDEDSATRVFDRQSVIPGLLSDGHAGHAPEPSHALAAPAPVTAAPSTLSAPSQEELRDAARAAQDTYRYMASNAQREAGPIVSRWLLVPVACLVASACALTFLHMRNDGPTAAPMASIVPKIAVDAPAAVVHEVHLPELPVTRPESPKPTEVPGDERPGARIELRDLGLDVTSTPWMEVFIDGKSMGHTPQIGLVVSAGEHDIELLNRDLGLETHAFVHAERGTLETQEISFE